ncbi:hypothetical protein KW791_00975 [Candidatus Parcubacteria bacterium]|nr:hypothetical protein [Candidatus Parcubacteria bacterium]
MRIHHSLYFFILGALVLSFARTSEAAVVNSVNFTSLSSGSFRADSGDKKDEDLNKENKKDKKEEDPLDPSPTFSPDPTPVSTSTPSPTPVSTPVLTPTPTPLIVAIRREEISNKIKAATNQIGQTAQASVERSVAILDNFTPSSIYNSHGLNPKVSRLGYLVGAILGMLGFMLLVRPKQ